MPTRDRKPAKRKATKKRATKKIKLTPAQSRKAKAYLAEIRKWRREAVKRAKKKKR
ncbi:MAG: hypothetical protein AAFQ94_09195 [Bacteroidota bacterium]